MNPNFFDLSKRKKEDVLSGLLTIKSHEHIISKKELNAIRKAIGETFHVTASPHREKFPKTKRTSIRDRSRTEKKKTTSYLSTEVLKNLDNVTNEIRSVLPGALRLKVSKSQVVNRAPALLLEEYKTRAKKSRLVRSLLHDN